MKKEILDLIKDENMLKYVDKAESVLDFLNQNPENPGEEKKACKFITKLLTEYGYHITTPYKKVKYSFKATKKPEKNSKKRMALLCEYDATNELGHTCGHSANSAASILTALSFENQDLPFDIDLIGTPNEEVLGGKIQLFERGAFKDYDLILMAHMNSNSQPYFKTEASCDLLVSFFGKSAHSAMNPWYGINALNGVRLLFSALDMMRTSLDKGQSIEGVVSDGGQVPNMVPKHASAYIYLRALDTDSLARLKLRVLECIKGVAKATETNCNSNQNCPEFSQFIVTDRVKNLVFNAMDEIDIKCEEQLFQAGSSDIGNLTMAIPVIHPMIAISDDEQPPILYTEEFAKAIEGEAGQLGMVRGALVLTNIIKVLSEDENLINEIKKEHQDKIAFQKDFRN